MAYRINVNGGIVQIRTNPTSKYSTFKRSDFIAFLLKVRSDTFKVINLDDGSKMVVREISFDINTEERYNEMATKLLHEKSYQKTALIYGPAIVILPGDWET